MQPDRSLHLQLPSPDSASAAHSLRVVDYIQSQITKSGGSISFAEFMQQALYAPGLGYYAAGATKLGAGGDFVTAPEISPLFGNVMARQSAEVLEQLEGRNIVEYGAGSGKLAATMLHKLAELDALPENYFIIEVSADLQDRQQRLIQALPPVMRDRVTWLPEIPLGLSGVIIANEVIDALPVEKFRMDAGKVLQTRVNVKNGQLQITHEEAPEYLANGVRHVEEYLGRQLVDGFESEVCTSLRPWIEQLRQVLHRGFVIALDYGVSRAEYYGLERDSGWLRCHFRHRAHNDALFYPGIQDLTAWVDFTAVAESAVDAGFEIGGFVTQAAFLMNGGLQQELENFAGLSVDDQLELSRQVKLLTLPAEMGENFKCIGLSRGGVVAPSGFAMQDRSHLL